jgi:hypothetical protein
VDELDDGVVHRSARHAVDARPREHRPVADRVEAEPADQSAAEPRIAGSVSAGASSGRTTRTTAARRTSA